MAVIRPFTGLRFTKDAGDLKTLVAPPYDVLSPEQRDEYAARNPHNIVHLTLPEQKADDRSKFVKYARSAADLADWRRSNALAVENKPAFYRYEQSFTIPNSSETFTRTSIIALIKTEPYSKGVVLPHEQTFPKHKEDRMRILEATRSHLECIFGLFEDPGGEIFKAISNASAEQGVEVDSDEGVHHKLEPITDPATCQKLQEMIADKKVWIADGHHRYETACAFREAQGEKPGLIAEDFMMMALSSMSDPGLVLLPTHRIVKSLPYGADEIKQKLSADFEITEADNAQLMDAIEDIQAKGARAFGVVLPGGKGLVLKAKDQAALEAKAGDESAALRSLDVTVLHRVIFEKLLGIQGLDSIAYTRDPDEAVDSVNKGAAAAFIMNPPTVEDMKTIALGGDKMPQKSTYYYPKILSGLVVWSLSDFNEPAVV